MGRNVLDRDQFEDEVTMWVFQENVDGKNLTDIINNEPEDIVEARPVKRETSPLENPAPDCN